MAKFCDNAVVDMLSNPQIVGPQTTQKKQKTGVTQETFIDAFFIVVLLGDRHFIRCAEYRNVLLIVQYRILSISSSKTFWPRRS